MRLGLVIGGLFASTAPAPMLVIISVADDRRLLLLCLIVVPAHGRRVRSSSSGFGLLINEPPESGAAGPRMNRRWALSGTEQEQTEYTLLQFNIAIIAYIANAAGLRGPLEFKDAAQAFLDRA